MTMKFHVLVVDNAGNPKEGVRVAADFGTFYGMVSEHTDHQGRATIQTSGKHATVEIYLNGSSEGEYPIKDGALIRLRA